MSRECSVWRRYVVAAFSACPTNLYEYCGRTRFCLLKVWLRSSLWFLEYEDSRCFPVCRALEEYFAWKTYFVLKPSAAMFRVFYMFSDAWPSLQSWSAAGAMVASRVQLHWCHSSPGVVCEAWAWKVQAPRLLRRSTPTYSRRPSISWSTTWHRLAAVCWMTCDVCLWCRSDVDCVWRRYFGSRVFRVSWTFGRPPDIVAGDTMSYFPDSHT